MSHAQQQLNPNINESQALLNTFLEQLQSGKPLTSATILESVFNLVMKAERDCYLADKSQDKANGFYQRQLGTPVGELDLQVPRNRQGDFRPQILPTPHQRDIDERQQLLEQLMLNGYSPNQIQRTFDKMGLHYNPEQAATLRDKYLEHFQMWQQRQLPHDCLALFIDAYHADTLVEGKVQPSCTFVILSIDWRARKDLVGIYHIIGHENKTTWLQILNQLIARGLKRPLYIVSDDFSGLKEAIATLFPQTLHQLCFVHLQRNINRNMGKQDAARVNHTLKEIRLSSQHDAAMLRFNQLCDEYENKYPSFIAHIRQRTQHYLAFLKLPTESRKFFYTTNAVESFNSAIEKMRQRLGGFFQSQDIIHVNIFAYYQTLIESKWAKGVPLIKAGMYELRQLFATQFGCLPGNLDSSLDSSQTQNT